MMAFKVPNDPHLGLVLLMSALGPRIHDIQKAHAFQSQKSIVPSLVIEFAFENTSDSAEFTNEPWKIGKVRQKEASIVAETSAKGWTNGDTMSVILYMTGSSHAAVQKLKPRRPKATINHLALGIKPGQTACTAVLSVGRTTIVDAKGWSRELGPSYHQAR